MLIDKTLPELLEYKGINECPEDIDEFWDKSVEQMRALGTDCELIPWDFKFPGVECYDLYFTGMGGARIHAHFCKPEHINGKAPLVLKFHGYTSHCGSFSSIMQWAAAGVCVAALDCRGQHGLSEDNGQVLGNTFHGLIIRGLDNHDPEKLVFRNVFLDTAQLAYILMAMPYIDETRVAAYGGSQGGGLTLACAALVPEVKVAAPVYPFLSDYRRVWEMDLDVDAYQELKDYFRHMDPLHEHEKEIFTMLGYIDVHNLAHRIKAKVRMYTGMMDVTVPPSTQFAAFNAIPGEKDYRIYYDFAHEELPLQEDDTFRFILENI